MVASEATPFAKTGGLADVLGALPPALTHLGEEVAVVLPRHRQLEAYGAQRIWEVMRLSVGPFHYRVAIDQVVRDGVRYLFVDCPEMFDRPGLYGEPDDHIRYALLCQASLGIARNIFRPDIFHCHDWQAGMLPAYLRGPYAGDPTFLGLKCVFTIHNLGYQGNFGPETQGDLGVGPSLFHSAGLEFWEQVSFMKAGIVYSDRVNTVSPTYAREIQTEEFGFGMDGLMRDAAGKLSGILNGVDYRDWNPESDPYLCADYSAQDLSGKLKCKQALIEEMELKATPRTPLIGIVSRLAYQKGFDLFLSVAEKILAEDVVMVALGNGEPAIEDAFRDLAELFPDKFAVQIGYNGLLAHRIEAGADMFLMPSRYEPCGLNQIYSLRYGTVPIVRATGGLEDTVDTETGFKFSGYEPEALEAAVQEALAAYRDPRGWKTRMLKGMAKDFSWAASAQQYRDLYQEVL